MTQFQLSVDDDPQPDDLDRIRQGLNQHTLPHVEERGFVPIAVYARNACDEIVGGAFGKINWAWFHLKLLWVAPELRSQGLGSQLLQTIESQAKTRGCRFIHLETLGFQARSFYLRHAYSVFATLQDYPPGHARTYLKKSL